jgi:hypothetical protein
LYYLDSCRKPEHKDPRLWIGTYTRRIPLVRIFKWLYCRGIDSPKQRNELAVTERKPNCIQAIADLKRIEISCKPSDLWNQEAEQ